MPAFVRVLNPLPHLRRRRAARPLCTAALDRPPPPPAIASKTKFVVLSDLHVRRESVEVALQALQRAHDAAAERGAAVLFLGDFWHARGALPVDPLNRVLTHLSNWAVPLVMIPGNHDLITRAGTGVSLVPLATTLGPQRCMLLTRPSLALDALWLPYTHDAVVLKHALAEAAALQTPPRAVFCHVEVAGARLAGAVVSRDRRVDADDFPSHARVYSGHLHRPHTVGPVQYVGSPYQVSAAEAGQQKALLVLDRLRDWAEVERVPLDIGPRHFAIDLAAPYIIPPVRAGDRITVAGAHGEGGRDFVASLRDRDVRVEVVDRTDPASGPNSVSRSAGNGDGERIEPRISPGGISNADLFRRYSEIKNLEQNVLDTGLELLTEVGSRISSASSGKDVVVRWDSVTLKGFGTFLDEVEYPLADRGLVLVTGCDCDDDGALSGRTNATGKTTLIMSALWAWTGRTDPRPDGSVEKGVSLEMVHDDAKFCEVAVNVRLFGNRVFEEVEEMMTPEQRLNAKLGTSDGSLSEQGLEVKVTRSSTRQGSVSKTRSYRQALSLEVNGVDISCLDLRETQNRIDRLVDGTLLPHTVFFGQHMGAGRGLLDVTDRTLKDHLALIFPLDTWVEARKVCRAKLAALQEKQVTSEASLQAAKAVLARLQEAEQTSRDQVAEFETERLARIAGLNARLRDVIASRCDVLSDSIIGVDSIAPGGTTEELERVVKDLRTAVRATEHPKPDELDRCRAAAAADLARSTARVQADTDLRERADVLLRKAGEWESERQVLVNELRSHRTLVKDELDDIDDVRNLELNWRKCVDELNECDRKLQELVDLNVQPSDEGSDRERNLPTRFGDQLLNVASARRRTSRVRDEKVRLQTTLRDLNQRLAQSSEYLTRIVSATDTASLVSNTEEAEQVDLLPDDNLERLLTCDKCLRPFDGDLFESARIRLESEARETEGAVREAGKRVELEERALHDAMRMLSRSIEAEKNEIFVTKKTVGSELARIRGSRTRHGELVRQMEAIDMRISRKQRDENVYVNELLALNLGVQHRARGCDVSLLATDITAALQRRISESEAAQSSAQHTYDKIEQDIRRHEKQQAEAQSERQALQDELDDMVKLQAECAALDSEISVAATEGNPFEESLRVLETELARETALVEERAGEHQKLFDIAVKLKAVDVAFGPRGVPSFLLEEGLMWLEAASHMYLQKLSDGELSLQIRAFSDYKTVRSDENSNKEVISKRILVRRKRNDDNCNSDNNSGIEREGAGSNGDKSVSDDDALMRERALRQLSGGQRRRCSLAFALAFADLARERAGFESSMVVFDEVLQSLDQDGRVRVAKLLPQFMTKAGGGRDSVFVVAQDESPEVAGLATGGIDVVERQAERSKVYVDGKIGGEGLQ